MIVIILTIAIVTLIGGAVSEIDLRYVDDTVNPCDDFYKFACGNFGKYHVKPENQSSLEIFTLTENELVKIGKNILSSPIHANEPTALKKVKSAYKACVNVVNVDDLDYYKFPEKRVIEEFGDLPLINNTPSEKISWTKIGEIAGKFGVHQMFQFMVKNFDPEEYAVFLFPDSSDKPEMFRPKTIKTYDEVLEESFKKYSQPNRRGLLQKDPLDIFFRKIADHLLQIHNVYKRDEEIEEDLNDIKNFATLLFNGGIIDDNLTKPIDVITLGQLQNWTQEHFGDELDINWQEYVNAHFKWANIDVTEEFLVYLIDPKSVYGILNLVRKTDPKVVKNFILFRTFLYMAPDSDLPLRQAFEEYYKSLGLQYYERAEYCTRKVLDVVDSASFSFAVANDFANYHFDINKIPNAVQLIKNIIEAFKEALDGIDWLDDVSRSSVLQKLNNMVIYLGYPDFILNKSMLDHFYENVRICEWDNYANTQQIRAFRQAYTLSQLLNPDLWLNSPFEVNAYAIRASLRIMTPFAMLQSSFFHGNDPIFDYSRLGSILSHELVHHFDAGGVTYNENGSMNGLLSNSSATLFDTKTQCFVDQYNNYYVSEVDDYIDGVNTLNENLADNSGLKHALLAFRNIIKEQSVENTSKKYTIEQEFFINFATTWCSDESYDYLKNLVESDTHSPNQFRVIGTLSNTKEFSEAFNCPVGSKMNPENKCVLW